MAAFLRRLFHRHHWRWTVILMDGNFWTECSSCGAMWQIPPEDLSEMPADHPVERRIGIADKIAALPPKAP